MHPNRRFTPAPAIAKPPMDAPGVAYFAQVGGGDRKFFRCIPYRASLSQHGCGARWREAQAAVGQAQDRFSLCRSCPVGALHAGEQPVIYSAHYQAPVCPRCRKGGLRMIGDRVCISCYNRSREMAKGKNARGNVPAKLLAERPLHTVQFRVMVNGHSFKRRATEVVDLMEPVLQTLRTTKGDIAFAFHAAPLLLQGRLF